MHVNTGLAVLQKEAVVGNVGRGCQANIGMPTLCRAAASSAAAKAMYASSLALRSEPTAACNKKQPCLHE